MDNKSYFFVFWHMQLYMSWYIRSFFGFTFLNIFYFFKYFCTNIFHRRSRYTFYGRKLFHRSSPRDNLSNVFYGVTSLQLLFGRDTPEQNMDHLNIKMLSYQYRNSIISSQVDHQKQWHFFLLLTFSSYIIELFQLHDTIQIKWNHAWIYYNIARRSHWII